jgi:menaquinone-9 beta-reductase
MLRFLKQREIEKTHYAATLRQYWANVADMDTAIEVYTPPALPMSYFYMFPLPNNEVNVGYGMTSSVISKNKHNLRTLFAKLIQEDPVLAPRFAEATPLEKPKGWGLPLASLKRKTFGDGYLLVGDAASLVGPTSGEGIGTGMMSGFIAASFLRAAINLGDLSQHQFRNYDREVYRRLKQEIGLYRTVMRWQPWFLWDTLLEGAHLGLVHRQFQQQVSGWIKTAYTTKIDVKLD